MAADVRIDAEASFKESILHNPHNVKAMLGLALIHRYGAVVSCGVVWCNLLSYILCALIPHWRPPNAFPFPFHS
jgi:hypothetical protein